jgi:hypothetical protein
MLLLVGGNCAQHNLEVFWNRLQELQAENSPAAAVRAAAPLPCRGSGRERGPSCMAARALPRCSTGVFNFNHPRPGVKGSRVGSCCFRLLCLRHTPCSARRPAWLSPVLLKLLPRPLRFPWLPRHAFRPALDCVLYSCLIVSFPCLPASSPVRTWSYRPRS